MIMLHTHIKGLDGLRALAALAVFASHYDQIVFVDLTLSYFDLGQLFANGSVAVSLFFTLSGFLLSLPFWHSLLHALPPPEIKTYLLRRLARIVPAYYLCLSILLCVEGGWRFAFSNPDAVLHYLFLFNFTEFSIFSINAVFWTLAVEIQFYCLLPLLFSVLRKVPRRAGLVVLCIICSSLVLHYFVLNAFSQSIPWPWDTRLTWIRVHGAVLSHSILAHLPHFLSGVFAAWYISSRKQSGASPKIYEWIFCSTSLLLLIILSTPIYAYILLPACRYGFPIITILMTLLIVATPHSRLAEKTLDSLLLQKLGALSYGFYLYHLPILHYLDRTMQNAGYDVVEHGAIFAISSLLLALLTAFVAYHLLEQPVLRKIRARQSHD